MSKSDETLYSVPELATELAVTPRALRFYESKGLLKPRRVGNRRVYDRRDRGRLKLILRGKRLGFSLAEIREYLELYDADAGQTRQIKRLEKLVSARIIDLERQRAALDVTLKELNKIHTEVTGEMRRRGIASKGPEHTSRTRPRIRPKNANGGSNTAGPQGDPS